MCPTLLLYVSLSLIRFAAAVAKKMVSLGALTQGDRRSGMDGKSNLSMAHFDFDSIYGKDALVQVKQTVRQADSQSVSQLVSQLLVS